MADSGAPSQNQTKSPAGPMSSAPTKTGPLTAFAQMPQDVRFETQEAGEKVILFLRPHIITNLPWIILTVLMILAPGAIFPFLWQFLSLPVTVPTGYWVVGTLFWYVATFGFVLSSFLRWYFNIYIVTNERVVDIDFLYMLYKHFSEARIDKIQDLSYKSSGILAAVFNFGTVIIQTAGELPNFDFVNIPQPEKVIETIGELSEKSKNNQNL